MVAALGCSLPARADSQFVETDQLRVVYYDPAETYLVPHTVQSLLSALTVHERLFDYRPDGKINIWLKDFSDLANANARAAFEQLVVLERLDRPMPKVIQGRRRL